MQPFVCSYVHTHVHSDLDTIFSNMSKLSKMQQGKYIFMDTIKHQSYSEQMAGVSEISHLQHGKD
jgi:hypothetical protein